MNAIKMNYPLIEATLSDDFADIVKKLKAPDWSLRIEYQPQILAYILSLLSDCRNKKDFRKAVKVILGCGAGKTSIFLLALLIGIKRGLIKKSLLSAPTLSLIRQHIKEINDMISFGKVNGLFSKDWKLSVIEISSNTKQKTIKEEREEETEYLGEFSLEIDDEIAEQIKNQTLEFENIKYEVVPQNKSSFLKQHLHSKEIVVFIVCIPSGVKFAKHILSKESDVIFDFVVHDEFHNWQSQQKDNIKKEALEIFNKVSKLSSFWSATPRKGEILSYDNELFGEEIAFIPTVALKNWGYLKQNLVVKFICVPQLFKVSNKERQILEKNGVPVQAFYKEWAILYSVVKDQLDKELKPHILGATQRVAIIKQLMLEGSEFVASIKQLCIDSIINQMNGCTEKGKREEIFDQIRDATSQQLTLTLQHSLICEGIDATNFNVAVAMRGMSDIVFNQFANRVTRWHKEYDTAYLYFAIEVDDSDEYLKAVKTFIKKLWYIGLTFDDFKLESSIDLGSSGQAITPIEMIAGRLKEHRPDADIKEVVFEEMTELKRQSDLSKVKTEDDLDKYFESVNTL